MSVSKEFITYVEDQLVDIPELSKKRMFGGVLFKSEGKQLGIAFGDVLYFKISESLQEKYTIHDSKPFQYEKKEKIVTVPTWWSVPDEVLENTQELIFWAEEALQSHE